MKRLPSLAIQKVDRTEPWSQAANPNGSHLPKELEMMYPRDEHNKRWVEHLFPQGWKNPKPRGRYNLLVVGGGPAGLVAAIGAAGLGAKVALIENHLLGGDCLNVGCVPSKALLAAAKVSATARRGQRFGLLPGAAPGEVDFGSVMERLRKVRADLSTHDSAKRLSDLGLDLYLGSGQFIDSRSFRVGGERLEFVKACIATGARAQAPRITGLDQIDYLTNETVFTLTKLPRRLAVIGAGPIGCELSQAFARFGSQVTLFESMHGILPKEEREAAAIVAGALKQDGVTIRCCSRELSISLHDGQKRITADSHDVDVDGSFDEVIVAVGRTPNIENLGLEEAGVSCGPKGIQVNDRLQTTNARIFAAGDVASRFQFTHSADAMARIVIANALFMGRGKASSLVIPWATYTEPELAHVGKTKAELEEESVRFQSYKVELADVDRAVLDGEDDGFVEVHADEKGRVLGATIVAAHAGDMISELSLAMTLGIQLGEIAKTIHPYPTQSEAIRKIGDAYNRTRLTPLVRRLFSFWLSLNRK